VKTLFRGAVHGLPGADGVLTDGAVVAWVGKGAPPERPDEEVVLEPGELLAPGFIDLQVNGFGGRDAADGREAVEAISAALPPTGVTAFLPTIISAPVEQGAEFAGAVATAEALGARVLGAHIEGPFINPSFHGAHDRTLLTAPTKEKVEVIARAKPRLVTLAPELPGAIDAIKRLRRQGAVVSAGHTGADYDQGRLAIDAGVRFGTHIFNAMPLVHHRHPGIALALLLDSRVTVGLIADGEHVHQAVIRELLRLKGAMRIAMTTDQTAAAGVPPGRFHLSGRSIVSDGVVVRLNDGTLAGSASTMDELVRRTAALPGMTLETAVAMATAVPARVLGEKLLGAVEAGACADLVVLDREARVRLTMVGGRVRFRR
jgi:N-acetylglucosamine-6-phosphate deacetylase